MAQYIIEGGNKLEGVINASGSKNASLPIIAASILSGKTTTLYNVPNIQDIKITLEILRLLGCNVVRKNGKIIIDSNSINKTEIPRDLMHKLRSSVILAGAIIGRFKKAVFSYPGGCDIGSRPIDLHIKALKKLGINIEEDSGYIICKSDKIIGTDIDLDFPSVGVTENIMLAAVLAEGETVVTNAAMEPEIVDLQNFLNRTGAKISGAGTNIIKIIGVKKLKTTSYKIMPDRIEAGTYALIGAAVGDKLKIRNIVIEHIQSLLDIFDVLEVNYRIEKNNLIVSKSKIKKGIVILTSPYPGFPTDLQQPLTTFLSVNKGTSVIIESIYDNRFAHIKELNRMGANIQTSNMNIIIHGVEELNGTVVSGKDLRGAASLVLAGLMAKGETIVSGLEYINRGYENMIKKLRKLHAKIELSLLNIEENEDEK